jgi:hypothetical protein
MPKISSKGTGKLKCHICGKPVRDHSLLGPCPELQLAFGERLVLDNKGRNRSTERKQAWRKRTGKP